jgi:molybdopterin-guanine dinucleotide biosynthesis protein A
MIYSPKTVGIAGAVLIGGKSQRMGTDKAALQIDGVSLLDRQLRLLRAIGASQIMVSIRKGSDPVSQFPVPDIVPVVDQWDNSGPLAGVVSCLAATAYPLLMVIAVDLPALTVEFLSNLSRRARKGVGVVPVGPDGYEPLAAIYPIELQQVAEAHLKGRQLSMQEFIKSAIAAGHMEPRPIAASESRLFLNWNRPEDIAPL